MKIKHLKLYSSNLHQQVSFYGETLGLHVLEQSEDSAVIAMGETCLNLIESKEATPYHFAINIPCNQEIQALNWVTNRVEVLKDGDAEIQDFENWNAKAIYFYDRDKNIVELIVRKNLENSSDKPFGSDSLIAVSEIGLPVKDIGTVYQVLRQKAGLNIYDGDLERFCAVGDEHGLFICVNYEIKDWFPTGDKAFASDFEIEFEENNKTYYLTFRDENIRSKTDNIQEFGAN